MQDSQRERVSLPETKSGISHTLGEGPSVTRRSIGERLVTAFQRWSIERRVLVGFGLVFAGILVISAVSYRNMTVLFRNTHQDQRSHDLIELLVGMGTRMDEAEIGHRR
jgi:hypothetical protein